MERAMTAMNTALTGLRHMIASGELGPGQKFPTEPELCERLGVSRSSLREAVRTLGALGVIKSRHGLGTYVSSLDPAEIVESFSLTIDLLPLEGLLQLLEMRRVLEGYAAACAAAYPSSTRRISSSCSKPSSGSRSIVREKLWTISAGSRLET